MSVIRKLLIAITIALSAFYITAEAADNVYVHRHITKSGTIVQQHYRTAPDHNRFNNWSSKGQANPYTGKRGTKNP